MAENEKNTAPGSEEEPLQQTADEEGCPQAETPGGETTDKKADKKERKALAALEKELGGMKKKLTDAEKDLAGAKDTLMRTAAEYDNYRKRTSREKDMVFNNGLTFAVTQLLPVADALEMAAAAPTEDENFKKGVEMTLAKWTEAMSKLGIEEIDALNKPFDPEMHSAVLQQPAPEGVESGTVLQVLQKGYKLGDKVVRHATVAVAE